jgi:hypothetical protein
VCGDDRGARHSSSIVERMFDFNGFPSQSGPAMHVEQPDGDAE